MTLTHVLTPIRIADVEIRNRVVRAAHATGLARGRMSDDLIAYHLARGRGGVGLSIIEILGVHWTSPSFIGVSSPDLGDHYRKLVDTVRPTGMRLFQQLWHAGHSSAFLQGSPPWSSSNKACVLFGQPSIPMTKGMIDEVIDAYADAARRCYEWGLDGVEVHGAHGYLPHQFLSPAINDRDDEYGGPFENRVRFLSEVLQHVRAAVPAGFPVGVRLAPDEIVGGVDVETTRLTAQHLERLGLIDYVNISLGNYQTFGKMIGGMHEPAGYEMPTSVPISGAVALPSIVTGRFRTLEEADQVIRAGDASMVSMVRALIADPDLVNKSIAGQSDSVRPCIACNQGCLAGFMEEPHRMGCTINPGAGFERTVGDDRLLPTTAPKRVLVVGGGPAGMEAARVAAIRGHKVVLAEATHELGGALLAAARAPTRHGLRDFTNWQMEQIYSLGVEVRLSSYIDKDDVIQEQWDSIIVAAGSTPRMDGVQNSNPGEAIVGMDQPNVISSNDLMLGTQIAVGQRAVVIDDVGHYEGLAAAEYLAHKGVEVAFVTRHMSIAPRIESAQMVEPALIRLEKLKFSFHLRTRATAITSNGVVICPTYLAPTAERTSIIPADWIVFVSLNHGNRSLFDDLRDLSLPVTIIGDANSPRYLPTAVREGHMAGSTI